MVVALAELMYVPCPPLEGAGRHIRIGNYLPRIEYVEHRVNFFLDCVYESVDEKTNITKDGCL